EYPAKIHVRSKLHYFPLIKDRFNEARRSLFRTTCFGPWLDISYVENDDGMIHYVLQKNGDILFRNGLFTKKIGYDVKIIEVLAFIEDEEKFLKVSDEDAIRLCLLLSLEVIFMGRELVFVVDDAFLRMVNYLDAWNSFSWGEHIWRQLYDSIRNVCSKHKLEHLDGLRKNPNHVPSYTLFGFLFAFEDMTLKGNCFFSQKNEDLSHSTSEDEPDNKDDISPKEDACDVYCCDVNGDVSQCFIPSNVLVEKGDCEIRGNKMEEDYEKKIQSEIQRLYKLMKARKFVDVVRSPYTGLSTTLNVPSMEELVLSRPFKRNDRIYLSRALDQWLSRSDVGCCKLPWCNDILVDSSLWRGLCGLDDHRKGWLVNEGHRLVIPLPTQKKN
nr:hypothetical protein [Tanacetum cinerariifolium]